MAPRTIGRTTHVRISALDWFLSSNAPADLKARIQAIIAALEPYPRLDAAVLQAEQPALLARIKALSRAHVDLFRVLRGEAPAASTHSRDNVAASLRDKRNQLGRLPTIADYPPGHVVPILATAYYGGVAAWGAGVGLRRQKCKGHWRNRAVQLAAVRDTAERFPGEALTHTLLRKVGYHALATAVPGKELAGLAAELGLDRHLCLGSPADWPAERCIDAYAALCREHGATLSCTALASLGGAASSLRSRAQRHFSTFRAFQQEVARLHPDVRLRQQRVARDGTVLDSWSEVVVHNALRHALPDVAVAVHVLLPDGRRSCDLVVGGVVHVEVLGIAVADLPSADTARKQKYARQWAAKQVIYAAMGVPLVVVEPADVYDPARLAVRVAEVARLLDVTPVPPAAVASRSTRAKGFWTFSALCEAVAEVAAVVGGFPTHAQLAAAGYGHAAIMLREPGTRQRVSDATGVPLRNEKNIWTREGVVTGYAAWAGKHGEYPSAAALKATGQSRLAGAARRLFAREQDTLRILVERRCGLTLPRHSAVPGSYDSLDKLEALIRPLCDELGCFPTVSKLLARFPGTLYAQLSRQIGMQGMAAHMGLPYAGPRRRTRAEALEEFQALLATPCSPDLFRCASGQPRLTTTRIVAGLGSRGISMLQTHFGGIGGLNAALAAALEGPDLDQGSKPIRSGGMAGAGQAAAPCHCPETASAAPAIRPT